MANNLTIEAPNFEKIQKESGQFTSDAISTIWQALNYAMKVERMDFRRSKDSLEPKILTVSPSASVDNLDLQGCSVVSFIGSSAVNLTGFKAPETNESRVLFIQVSGSATITLKNTLTSETANQIATSTGADYAMTTGKGLVVAYLASKWREVARSG